MPFGIHLCADPASWGSGPKMKKLILRCGYSPGDIVILTAAVRDLHRSYPGQFLTDVRTRCDELLEHNPHLVKLEDADPSVEELDCNYPLINDSNETPHHCLHGFAQFLSERLKVNVCPSVFRGDIHLSAEEKAWYSQVHEVAGREIPFWIVAAGGKYVVTIKWWETRRYQEVVDHFRGRIQFVQVGELGHHHPRLSGVIDLRGKTDLRQLVRLVHHAQGVLCSVTALMHLCAAVETRPGCPSHRPCVVVAGGREPAHWEAYPNHQFIHTNGALACGASGGCWKDRVVPLRDGDPRDHVRHRCEDVVGGLPRCLGMITPAEVARRIELYFAGGALQYLTTEEQVAAARAVIATAGNPFDKQPLNFQSAGLALDEFVRQLPAAAGEYAGRGIVICAGGIRYLTNAWVGIRQLRSLGCRLPVEIWHLGPKEMDPAMADLLRPFGVECVDACKLRRRHPVRHLAGWELKAFAILHSQFREVLFLDADNFPVRNPEYLFAAAQYQKTGAILWPDYLRGLDQKAAPVWRSCGLRQPAQEIESGQMLWDKRRCEKVLRLALWFNENSDFYYRHLHGDKDTFQLAFRKLRQPFSLIPHPVKALPGAMCQHDFEGRRVFQHRNMAKWDLFELNPLIPDFREEAQARRFLEELRSAWDGGKAHALRRGICAPPAQPPTHWPPRLEALVVGGEGPSSRAGLMVEQLRKMKGFGAVGCVVAESAVTAALRASHERGTDYLLWLSGDLEVHPNLPEVLLAWPLLRSGSIRLASLYNPGVQEVACDLANQARWVDPAAVPDSPLSAFLVARETVGQGAKCWPRMTGPVGRRLVKLSRLAKGFVPYHAPSLVRPLAGTKEAAGSFGAAVDFRPDWRA